MMDIRIEAGERLVCQPETRFEYRLLCRAGFQEVPD